MLSEWATRGPDVVAAGLAGSWARGDARKDSDVDLVVLTTDPRAYLEDEAWMRELGGFHMSQTRAWGPMTERRFVLPSRIEVEAGIASPVWAATDPVDDGTRNVVRAGFRVLYDPDDMLTRLVEACR